MPEFTYTVIGFVNNDDETSFIQPPTVETTVTDTSLPGEFEIIVNNAIIENYNIEYINAVFTISESVNIIKNRNKVIAIYPNPCTDGFYIKNIDDNILLQIYNLTGEIIYNNKVYNNTFINTSSLKSGLYLIKIDGHTEKLIIK